MRRGPLVAVIGVVVVFAIVGALLALRSQSGSGKPVTFDVNVTGASHMSPDRLPASHNDTVTINVRSDQAGEVHLHGYDLHFETKPGEVSSQTFHADKTGDFEIEWESTSTHLGDLVVNP
jgi:hypothetical protein